MSFPSLRMWEWANNRDPTRPVIKFSQLFHVLSQRDAEALFASRLAANDPEGGPFSRAWPRERWAEQWAAQQQEVEGEERGWRFRVLDFAVAVQPFLLNNWWAGRLRGRRAGWLLALMHAKRAGSLFPGMRARCCIPRPEWLGAVLHVCHLAASRSVLGSS